MKLATVLLPSLCHIAVAENSDFEYYDQQPDYFYKDYQNYEDYNQWTNEIADNQSGPSFGPAGRSLGVGTLDFESDNQVRPFNPTTRNLNSMTQVMPPGFDPQLRRLGQTWRILAHLAPGIQASVKPNRKRKNNQHKMFLKNHGCYCYVSEDEEKIVGPRNGYNGPPLDELDALCMTLYKAQKCLSQEMDQDRFGSKCQIERNYPFILEDQENDDNGNPLLSDEELIKCYPKKVLNGGMGFNRWAKRPKNKCRMSICELEREFAIRVKNLWNSGYRSDNLDIVGMDDQQYAGKCVNLKKNVNIDAECCGEGMNRRPFDTVNKMCCADQSLAPVGSC